MPYFYFNRKTNVWITRKRKQLREVERYEHEKELTTTEFLLDSELVKIVQAITPAILKDVLTTTSSLSLRTVNFLLRK